MREDVVAGRGQSIAAHSPVVFIFVSSFAVRSEANDDISILDSRIVDNILFFHPAHHRAVDDDGADEVSKVRRFSTRANDVYAVVAQQLQEFLRSIDDGGDHFSGNEVFVPAVGGGKQNVFCRTDAKQVIDV